MILNSAYFRDFFSTPEMRKIFSDHGRIDSWLLVESRLAHVQAKLGMIPAEAAEKIALCANIGNINIDEMRDEYMRVGFPILPFVHQLASACDKESSKWIHWGATTQDIIDTGLVLQMRDAFTLLEQDLRDCIDALSSLVSKHKNTVMPGRTFQQQAAPITFGFKAAIWLDELLRHYQRLEAVKSRALLCSYGGAVGNLSTLGDTGYEVLMALAVDLNLGIPSITWHTARDSWAEVIFWLSLVSSSFSKIATEVSLLMRTEVGEVREPFMPGRGASSTMPQKRNPIACPVIIAAATRLRDSVPTQLSAMLQEHERSVSGQPTEWLVIPEAFVLSSGVFAQSKTLLEGLDVDVNRMAANLKIGNGLLMAESVMMGLAPLIGRGKAHSLVSKSSNHAIENHLTLRESLLIDKEVMSLLSVEELDSLLNPSNYLGSTQIMIDRVLNDASKVSDLL